MAEESIASPSNETEANPREPENHPALVLPLSPLIKLTLIALYLVLMLPLPILAQVTAAPIPLTGLILAIALGGLILYTTLTEQVQLDVEGIRVTYPDWVPRFFRRGWSLQWSEVRELKPRSTGQGGLVYYLVSHSGQAYLLPVRVAGFARMVREIKAQTGIDTTLVRPLAQPWMYGLLLFFTLLMGLVDGWVLWNGLIAGPVS